MLKQTQWAGQHILPLLGETGLVYLLNNNSNYPRGEPKSEHRHFRKNFPVDLLVFLVPSLSTVQGLSLVMVIQAKLFICSTSVHDLDGTPKRIRYNERKPSWRPKTIVSVLTFLGPGWLDVILVHPEPITVIKLLESAISFVHSLLPQRPGVMSIVLKPME